MSLHEFLTERLHKGVLLQADWGGARGIVHDLDPETVTLWNPRIPFWVIPLEDVWGWTNWGRMDIDGPKYESCVRSQTCPLHYPAG